MNKYETYDIQQIFKDGGYFLAPHPVQAFAEFEENDDGEKVIKGGIAYKNNFICGCCGNVYQFKDKWIKKLYVYEDWVDVSDQITGTSVDDLRTEKE